MNLKKILTHADKRTVWRLLLNNESLLLIEERDLNKREVFFQCYDFITGKKVFRDLQVSDKFWTGIEAFRGDILYFHGYRVPEMPWHQGIYAYSVAKKKIIWENPDYVFAFLDGNTLFGMQQQFESTKYYAIDALTGELLGEQPEDETIIRQRRAEVNAKADYSDYNFPVQFTEEHKPLIDILLQGNMLPGETVVEFLATDDMLFAVLQEPETPKLYRQRLVGIAIPEKSAIFNEIINENQKAMLFDSFFFFKNIFFVILNKEEVRAYSLTK